MQNPENVFIPKKSDIYVPWGHYRKLLKIFKSEQFFPIFITGLSGTGKTVMVEQACHDAKREYIRIQINPETDEDDLIGGFRLQDGNTVFEYGPVIKAMKSGAILLIDEVDRGSHKLMALQGVLEGKPILIKKIGEMVTPSKGFSVVATANTKGQGSEDGKFAAATVIDEAFLERFAITLSQPHPSKEIEKEILQKHFKFYGCTDDEFRDMLLSWAFGIRKTYDSGGINDTISTRRLCQIIQTHSIFDNRIESIFMCIGRFDKDTAAGFVDLYNKIDGSANPDAAKSFISKTSAKKYKPF